MPAVLHKLVVVESADEAFDPEYDDSAAVHLYSATCALYLTVLCCT